MNCSQIDGNRIKNRFVDLLFVFTLIFDLFTRLSRKKHAQACFFHTCRKSPLHVELWLISASPYDII